MVFYHGMLKYLPNNRNTSFVIRLPVPPRKAGKFYASVVEIINALRIEYMERRPGVAFCHPGSWQRDVLPEVKRKSPVGVSKSLQVDL
eukprot:758484-Hanusia_phi.AAC.6